MFDKKDYMEIYRIKNKDRIRQLNKIRCDKWRENNPEYNKGYAKQWKENNSDYMKHYMEQWHKENPDYQKIYRKNNPEYRKEWWRDNSQKISKQRNNKYRTDLKFNLNHKISNAISTSLKGNKNGRHWENLVGYTLNDLIKHLQITIPIGYKWQDYFDEKLHIDHIIPINVFNFTKPEHTDFQRCWSLSNLQLLPAEENISKSNKLKNPFQPALAI